MRAITDGLGFGDIGRFELSVYELVPSVERLNCLSFIIDEDMATRDKVNWRMERAQQDPANPLLEPFYPWDNGAVFTHGSVLRDPIDGLWKAWYVSTSTDTEHSQNAPYPLRWRYTKPSKAHRSDHATHCHA